VGIRRAAGVPYTDEQTLRSIMCLGRENKLKKMSEAG